MLNAYLKKSSNYRKLKEVRTLQGKSRHMEDLLMRVFLKEMLGLIIQHSVEVMLWLGAVTVVSMTWYLLWPIEELVIAGAITFIFLGATASVQQDVAAFFKSQKKRPQRKKK